VRHGNTKESREPVASALLDAIARGPQDPATQVRRFLSALRRQPTP